MFHMRLKRLSILMFFLVHCYISVNWVKLIESVQVFCILTDFLVMVGYFLFFGFFGLHVLLITEREMLQHPA